MICLSDVWMVSAHDEARLADVGVVPEFFDNPVGDDANSGGVDQFRPLVSGLPVKYL